jgi:hypothetical protein
MFFRFLSATVTRFVSRQSALLASAVVLTGCANLEVRRVPNGERAAGCDRQEGFRYYLNRPYVVVKEPILVMERRTLVKVDGASLAPGKGGPEKPPPPKEVRMTFLDGPRAGQTFRLGDLPVENPASNGVRLVSPQELQTIQDRLKAMAAPGDVVTASFRPSGNPQTVIVNNEIAPGNDGFFAAAAQSVPSGTPTVALSDIAEASLTMPDKLAVSDPTVLKGAIDIIYLPDLDEQYVVKSKNCLAKSAFGLAFKNGTELVEVQGEHDTTTVALSFLNLLQTAINAASGIEQQRATNQAKSLQSGSSVTKAALADIEAEARQKKVAVWQLVERVSIKPGVYRLNKPWENSDEHGLHPVGCGLLAKLGLPTTAEIVDFRQIGTISPSAPTKSNGKK